MKTLMLMLMVPSFLLGAEPTGGTLIVPPNKRDVQYYDFQAREEVSLTKDVKGPSGLIMTAAISANGEVLAWVQGGKIWWRELPFGPAKLAPNKNSRRDMKDSGVMGIIPVIVPGILKNFCLSAGGRALTYEVRAPILAYNTNGVWTKTGIINFLIFHPLSASTLDIMGAHVWGNVDDATQGGLVWATSIRGRNVQTRIPCFGAWSRTGAKLAIVSKPVTAGQNEITFHTHAGIDPSVGRTDFAIGMGTKHSFLGNCQGLAWKLDGTITYIADDTLYDSQNRIIATGVKGDVFWVNDSDFLYRGNGALYFMESGTPKKVPLPSTAVLSFCARSPFSDKPPTSLTPVDPSREKESSGTIQARSDRVDGQLARLVVGNISIKWANCTRSINLWMTDGMEYVIVPCTSLAEIKSPATYTFSKQHKAMLSSEREAKTPNSATIEEVKNPSIVRLWSQQTVLIRWEGRYAALQLASYQVVQGKFIPEASVTVQYKYWPNTEIAKK